MTQQKIKHMPPKFSVGEEIANAVTHGVGALLSVAGLTLLLVKAISYGTWLHVLSVAIYGTSLFLLHLSSTLYHALHAPRAKRVFWIFDHAAIYLLIAGSYTPFLLISLWGEWGLVLMIAIWAMAILGIVFKSLFIGRLRKTSVALYITMGWLIVIAGRQLWLKVPHEALLFVFAGGLLYTGGVGFYCAKRMPYGHMIWHLFVLGGSACHYFAILFWLLPSG